MYTTPTCPQQFNVPPNLPQIPLPAAVVEPETKKGEPSNALDVLFLRLKK